MALKFFPIIDDLLENNNNDELLKFNEKTVLVYQPKLMYASSCI